MEQPTAKDAILYLNQRLVEIWNERGIKGKIPTAMVSYDKETANISFKTNRGLSSFISVNKKLVATCTKPSNKSYDLNDGQDFYDLIDISIARVV